MEHSKLLIIGSGPAGLTAAIYSARGRLNPLMIGGVETGGQLMITTDVDDFPGFPEGIQGPELMGRMRSQAERFGTRILNESVVEVNFSKKPFWVKTSSDKEFTADAVIIATGASAKWLGLESEKRLIGRGVSACAVCDAPFFRNKKVVVVGGGDTALREALHMTKFASEVIVMHRRDKLRAMKELQERAFAHDKITWMWNTTINEFVGEQKVESLKVTHEGKEETVACEGVFVAIGHQPNTWFLKGHIDIDSHGYVIVKDNTRTNVEGVFVAGDVSDWRYRQAVTAAGEGTKAALDAEEYLEKSELPSD